MGALSNIHEDGFASVAFHSFPSTLKWDAYGGGDYGPNFFGYAMGSGAYLVQTKDFGWQGFGGTVSQKNGQVQIVPKDSFRKRVYLAPLGLFLTLDAGTFESVAYGLKSKHVSVVLSAGSAITTKARLRLETSAAGHVDYVAPGFERDADAYTVPLGESTVTLTLRPKL